MRGLTHFGLILVCMAVLMAGCGAMDFANYAVDSYHETQEGFDRRHGEGSHDLMLEGRLECCMCDGSGICSKCDGDGCVYCDGSGECAHCEGKGYTQEADVPGILSEIDSVLDKL